MIQEKFVDRFARNSGIKDKMIAEREIILTYALKAIAENNLAEHLAFKGGTALRKLVFGSSGRFSMDLDFTLCETNDRDSLLEKIVDTFNQEHYGVYFQLPEYYITEDETSFGGDVYYQHAWNSSSQFKLQISLRKLPILPVKPREMLHQEYLKELEFWPFKVYALHTLEMVSEKIRAAFQRFKVRDLYDLYYFGKTAFEKPLLRSLVVLKLWESRDPFDADIFFQKICSENYDWDDLHRLVRLEEKMDPESIIQSIESRYAFLRDATPLEKSVIKGSRSGQSQSLAKILKREILQHGS